MPRSRVQHIDVSQGPIVCFNDPATPEIYTAGTDHAKVELEGLEVHRRTLEDVYLELTREEGGE